MARIALDAMGGDFAPRATVSGALLAIGELDPGHSIQLVGRRDATGPLLRIAAAVEAQIAAGPGSVGGGTG